MRAGNTQIPLRIEKREHIQTCYFKTNLLFACLDALLVGQSRRGPLTLLVADADLELVETIIGDNADQLF